MVDVVPVGSNSLVICHWTNGTGHWEAITVNHNALNGHEQHSLDVWPPVDDITDGMNWPEGETLYLSNCTFATSPSESPSPSPSESSTGTATPAPTDTLPPTGAVETSGMLMVGAVLLAAGVWLKRRADRA
jgi:LPXTG-motif cell wall-anchored protein